MAKEWLTRSYNFIDKDPEIDNFRTLWQKDRIKENDLAVLAGLSPSTVRNMFGGETRRPQHATFAKMAGAMGYSYALARDAKPDYENKGAGRVPRAQGSARQEARAHERQEEEMMPRRINSRATSTLDAQIGLRMRAIRVDQGISQNALAKRLGLTFQQVQKYERGVNRLSLSRAVEVARTLKTSVNQLIGADGGGEIAVTTFDAQTYKLAQSLKRSSDLSPPVAPQPDRQHLRHHGNRQEEETLEEGSMTRIADDFDSIRRRLAELTKTTTVTDPIPTQGKTAMRPAPAPAPACAGCGTRMSDQKTAWGVWVCPRCGSAMKIS
jgi:transcriptional regulator with XRE-family HTH domain